MPIPGLKVLDEILAGLPTNSAQRIEIGKLKEQIAALEKENAELKEELAIYVPKSNLSPDALKILQFLFNETTEYTAEWLAHEFGWELGNTKYHCEKLSDMGLLESVWREEWNALKPRQVYLVTKLARAYLVEKGLVK